MEKHAVDKACNTVPVETEHKDLLWTAWCSRYTEKESTMSVK